MTLQSGLGHTLFLCLLKIAVYSFFFSTQPNPTTTHFQKSEKTFPLVVNTWDFPDANSAAWEALYERGQSPLDSLVVGGCQCDLYRKCGDSVGYGGHPDETGETTLDAMVMDGNTHRVGAVTDLHNVKSAMAVAHAVMKYTTHSMLAGPSATKFAVDMGFTYEDLHTNESVETWKVWQNKNCQPNYRQNVKPDPKKYCGPYQPDLSFTKASYTRPDVTASNHDTIGMIVMGKDGSLVAGTTTNGMIYKVPGRVADSPIVGAGAYVEADVGAAVATGDGDVMMRFLPSYLAVMKMEQGYPPESAAKIAINKIRKYYPVFSGAIVAVNITGHVGAACHNFGEFPYLVTNPYLGHTTKFTVKC